MHQHSPFALRALRTHYLVSALIWLLLPSLTLLAFRSSPWEPLFRAQPYNNSYDAMFLAAMAGLGLTAVYALFCAMRLPQTDAPPPVWFSWRTSFTFFQLTLAASLAVLNLRADAPATAAVWATALLCLTVTTIQLQRSQQDVAPIPRLPHRPAEWLGSALLVLFAAVFLAFPVLQPWSGPPQPFVRWHPFGLATELVWRGIFFSFAIGMLLSALEPGSRHRLFLVALVLSGYLHAFEMAADNLHAAAMAGPNGNHDHLYGDILGWFLIASLALLFLVTTRHLPARSTQPASL